MNSRIPIAFFAYNRPRHTERGLRALARCAGFDAFELHIFCDAPRRAEDEAAVQAVAGVVDAWAIRLDARVCRRKENLGLAGSIAGAVTELLGEHGRVVVIEDDLVVAPGFLDFMRAGLEAYAHDERVVQLSGCLLIAEAPCSTDALFLPLTTTWGWATWERAWREFPQLAEVSIEALDADPAFKARFTLDGRADYVDMLRRRLEGTNDSWGILWWYAVARSAGLVLYPRRSLVWNGGFDSSGVHCDGDEIYRDDAPASLSMPWLGSPPRLPRRVEADSTVLEQIVDRYFSAVPESRNRPWTGARFAVALRWPGRILRRLFSCRRRSGE